MAWRKDGLLHWGGSDPVPNQKLLSLEPTTRSYGINFLLKRFAVFSVYPWLHPATSSATDIHRHSSNWTVCHPPWNGVCVSILLLWVKTQIDIDNSSQRSVCKSWRVRDLKLRKRNLFFFSPHSLFSKLDYGSRDIHCTSTFRLTFARRYFAWTWHIVIFSEASYALVGPVAKKPKKKR